MSADSVVAYVQDSVDAVTAEGLPGLSGYPNAVRAVVVPGAACRVREDGVSPTAAVGMPFVAGDVIEFDGQLSGVKIISQAGACALDVTYYANRED